MWPTAYSTGYSDFYRGVALREYYQLPTFHHGTYEDYRRGWKDARQVALSCSFGQDSAMMYDVDAAASGAGDDREGTA